MQVGLGVLGSFGLEEVQGFVLRALALRVRAEVSGVSEVESAELQGGVYPREATATTRPTRTSRFWDVKKPYSNFRTYKDQ